MKFPMYCIIDSKWRIPTPPSYHKTCTLEEGSFNVSSLTALLCFALVCYSQIPTIYTTFQFLTIIIIGSTTVLATKT